MVTPKITRRVVTAAAAEALAIGVFLIVWMRNDYRTDWVWVIIAIVSIASAAQLLIILMSRKH